MTSISHPSSDSDKVCGPYCEGNVSGGYPGFEPWRAAFTDPGMKTSGGGILGEVSVGGKKVSYPEWGNKNNVTRA
jgi:hypothetical protein